METMEQKNERNARVSARYDELMREGRHGHYETMFRVVREEVERAAAVSKPEPRILQLNLKDFLAMANKHPDVVGVPVYYAVYPTPDAATLKEKP